MNALDVSASGGLTTVAGTASPRNSPACRCLVNLDVLIRSTWLALSGPGQISESPPHRLQVIHPPHFDTEAKVGRSLGDQCQF